ncbi:hypothetical protein EON79_14245 [bacterium]|nr:MAG: hypothetical protein EON79_14245 [bacterium]
MASRFSGFLPLAAYVLLPALAPAQGVVGWGGIEIPPEVVATRVSTGLGSSSLAIRPDGTMVLLYGFGPIEYRLPTSALATQISVGLDHCLAISPDGTVIAWGDFGYGKQIVPGGLVAKGVSAGEQHSLALRPDGTVVAWGWNANGQCSVPTGLVASQVVAGPFSSLALRTDGTVVGWGDNRMGELDPPYGLRAVQIAAGHDFSLALRSDGTVKAWGDNTYGQCNVPLGLYATQIAASSDFAMALRADGTVVVWGSSPFGLPEVPANLTGVLEVGASKVHFMALVAEAHCVVDQPQVYAGYSATGTVKLAHAAPVGGTVVNLVSDDPNVRVPASVTLPEGTTSATFPIATDPFTGPDRTVSIRTVYGATESAKRTVPAKFALKGSSHLASFASPTVTGGSTTRPQLTVSVSYPPVEDVVLDLASDNPAVGVPATVTIPAGATSAKVVLPPTALVASPTTANISLSRNGVPVASAILTVNPYRATLGFDSPVVTSGESALGTVDLNSPVARAITVTLASNDPAVTVPASVIVRAGAKYASFPVTTAPVGTNRTARVMATVNGNVSSAALKLLAVPAVKSLLLPDAMSGNGRIQGTVRLTMAAKAGGAVVRLASSSSSLTVPATVTVPEGQYTATFPAYSGDVPGGESATVTASADAGSATESVVIRPLTISSFVLSASTVVGGQDLTATVRLNADVAVETVLTLISSDPLVTVPATVTVPPGTRTVSFTLGTSATARAKNVRITIAKSGSSLYRTVKVTP